jgi:hypothetical protein
MKIRLKHPTKHGRVRKYKSTRQKYKFYRNLSICLGLSWVVAVGIKYYPYYGPILEEKLRLLATYL